jgi:hypothetical protein
MVEVNNGIPVQLALEKKTLNTIPPVGLKPLINVAVSEADAGESPIVMVLG